MNQAELEQKKATLETQNDQLLSELAYIDQLMRKVGFSNGLETVKATAYELIEVDEELEGEQDKAA